MFYAGRAVGHVRRGAPRVSGVFCDVHLPSVAAVSKGFLDFCVRGLKRCVCVTSVRSEALLGFGGPAVTVLLLCGFRRAFGVASK